jgi:hypothetical protein
MNRNIEVIALIYQSVDYLNFIANQLKSELCRVDGWDVSVRIIANDATPAVIAALPKINIPYTIYNNPNPNEYYINRVYRCHNHGALTSKSDNICFANSDLLFSHNWLANLLRWHDGINIPVSRLVESGKMPTADNRHGISMYFGTHPNNIDYMGWCEYSSSIRSPGIIPGGLLGPVIFEKQRFIEAGMYPEGNIYRDGVGTCNGDVLTTSDVYFFDFLEKQYNMQHVTVLDSICYHIQEGEKDENVNFCF